MSSNKAEAISDNDPKKVSGELMRDALKPAAKKLGTDLKPAGAELAQTGVTLAKTVNMALSRSGFITANES